MELELQGQPGSSGSGSSGSHVVSIHDEELPRHTGFLTPSFVNYNAYHKLRPPQVPMDVNEDIMSRLQKQVDDYYNPKQKQVDDHNKPKFTYSEKWIFFLVSLGLETISASFDQLSSPSKPHYALYGMLLAIAAVIICICELIHKGYGERVEFKRWGRIWWYYHPYPSNRLFGNFPDICGLVLAIAQSICSGVQYLLLIYVFGVMLAIAAVLTCIWELIYKTKTPAKAI